MSMKPLRFPSVLLAVCLVSLISASSFAQSGTGSRKLPKDFLKKMTPKSGMPVAAQNSAKRKTATAAMSSVSGIDSLTNWTDQFTEPGFDGAGNPQSVWPYAMVGDPPESNHATHIHAPIIPVTVQLLDASGNVAHDPTSGAALIMTVTPGIKDAVIHSPMFESDKYTSGRGQFTDQLQRASFWNRFHHNDHDWDSDDDHGWHTLLRPDLRTTRTMSIANGNYFYATNDDGSCCLFLLVEGNAFSNALFPPTFPVDNTTVIGAAELAGDMTTRDLTTFLFNNVYLYNGDLSNCCVLGFHEYDFEPGTAKNGNLPRLYVMDYSSWISPGLFGGGFEDITALSHEVSETFNDPFVNNATPWWLSLDPFTGGGLCQNNLETGDVIEVLSNNTVYPIAHHNRTYHPQNEAMFPWFAFQSPSTARLGAYSFPDETTLTTLSPANLMPGCNPGP